ncbi:OB-fold domain-containing protein [Nocardioides sp. TRM66260-LWL]|uniref:Zn-ribbon domain-containing OB-fold protein n=1 Tax=Nocardioides sp. TRM66260-LWL TaxID=2874478 RepID=UPI001CC6A5BF|nr:OB-fold domain-containing protein [Nocardioides sp. TRM66260-LWL]MBZ5736099.1 OB-fold domain-containing protein [Nocardioides sp. TRM66260-LWL]
MTATPAIEGWFTTDPEPALTADRCTTCGTVFFPPTAAATGFCRNPGCDGETFESASLSRRGTVWSYTDAQYRPPAPYVPATDPYEPFALAAVELPEGLVVLGQVAEGFGVADLRVGAEVEVVVETLHVEQTDDGPVERTIWRWRPIAPARAEEVVA